MKEYEGFIAKIREDEGKADYDRLLSRIEMRVSRRRAGVGVALAGALAVMLLAFAVYFYYPGSQGSGNDVLMSFVFEQESVDGPLLDYVLEANGTF